MTDKIPIKKRLKELRQEAGLSQKKLGILAGIDEFSSSPRVNQYETGKHVPDFIMLKSFAKVLKVPTCYFYAENDDLANLIKLYGNFTSDQKKQLLNKATSIKPKK